MPHPPFNILPDPYNHPCHTHHLIPCHTPTGTHATPTYADTLHHTLVCSLHQLLAGIIHLAHKERLVQITMETIMIHRHINFRGHTHTVMKHHNITHSLISSQSWIWKNFRMKFFQALSKLQLILTVDISFKTGQPYPKLISLALSLGLIPSFFFPTTSSYPLNSYLPLQMSPSFNSLASGMPWQITSFTDLKNTMTSQWHHTWNGATGIVKWWKIDWWMISESGAGRGRTGMVQILPS